MSVVDLLVAMISVSTDIIWRITDHWYAGAAMCKIVRYLQVSVVFIEKITDIRLLNNRMTN